MSAGTGAGPTSGGINDYFTNLLQSISGLNLSEDQINQITQALPLLALFQQGQQADYSANYLQYQNNYLDYLNNERGLSQQQLDQAKQQMDFQNGPYWDWYTSEYFPAQQQMSANELGISDNSVKASMNQVAQEEERTRQARLATQLAYADAFKNFPTLRQGTTSDGRNVGSMLAYTLGYGG